MRVGTESDYREMGFPLVALGSVGGNASLLVPSWDGVREGERVMNVLLASSLSVALESGRDDDGPRHGLYTAM